MIVDADTHVVETEATWDHLDPRHAALRPVSVHPKGSIRRYWFIDGKTRGLGARLLDQPQVVRHTETTGRNVQVPAAARDMDDVAMRLAHMSAWGVDIQILLPTLFIAQVADRAEVEVPLCHAYNSWLAEICAQGEDRLRWAVVPPLLAMEEAIAELRRGKERGACAVFVRPIEGGRLLSDPELAPLYREAERLDLAIALHVGNANPMCRDLLARNNPEPAFWAFRLSLVGSFHTLVTSGVFEAHPRLRWALLEAGSQWLPFALQDIRRRFAGSGREVGRDFLAQRNVYVACFPDENLAEVIRWVGEDNLIIGSDYGHADTASDIDALRRLRDESALGASVVDKILSDNPCRLYGLKA